MKSIGLQFMTPKPFSPIKSTPQGTQEGTSERRFASPKFGDANWVIPVMAIAVFLSLNLSVLKKAGVFSHLKGRSSNKGTKTKNETKKT